MNTYLCTLDDGDNDDDNDERGKMNFKLKPRIASK